MSNAFVRKLAALAPLTPEEIGLLEAACSEPRDVPARHDLIREGDRPGPVHVIMEGWACRYKLLPEGGRQITAFFMPGDFDDMHVGTLAEMDHSIGTLTPCLVSTISRERIEELTEARPRITRALWWTQLVDEGTLRAWIVSMGRRDSMARVAHLMCELYVRATNLGLNGTAGIELPLTQTVIGDALGLTPVHVNRVLRRLRLAGVMELGQGTLRIADGHKLAQIAGFDDNYLHRRLRIAA